MSEARETILITGATGFIGRHAAARLAAAPGLRLVALVRPESDRRKLDALAGLGVTPVEGRFDDAELLARTFSRESVTRVLHLAAIRGPGAGGEALYRTVNVQGTARLLRAARDAGVRRFVHCSSVGVYGTIPRELPAGLETPLVGDNAYHRSKIAAEAEVERARRAGLECCIVRPAITYGPGDGGFPAGLVRLVRRRRLIIPRPEVLVHLLSVTALSEALALVLLGEARPAPVIILADREPLPLGELVDLISRRYLRRDYPDRLRVPLAVFRLLSLFFSVLGSEPWRLRLQLLSRPWHFETGGMAMLAGFEAAETAAAFGRYLERCG